MLRIDDTVSLTNIKHIPTYVLIMYKKRWDLMVQAGVVATYTFTPPYTLAEIETELKDRQEPKGK